VVIPIIDENGILVFKTECHTPVSAYFYGPMASQFTLQRVKVPPRDAHAAGTGGAIQSCQLIFESDCVRWMDASFRAVQVEPFESCVPERLEHFSSVSPGDTGVNVWTWPRRKKLREFSQAAARWLPT
jgi:hypothetical protein